MRYTVQASTAREQSGGMLCEIPLIEINEEWSSEARVCEFCLNPIAFHALSGESSVRRGEVIYLHMIISSSNALYGHSKSVSSLTGSLTLLIRSTDEVELRGITDVLVERRCELERCSET